MPDPTDLGIAEFRDIAERALPNWGIRPSRLEFVSNAENCAFRVVGSDGGVFVLRVHRPGYHSLNELESERMWTRALIETGISAPVGCRTHTGREYAVVATPDGESSRAVGLIEWVEGTILDDELENRSDPGHVAARFEQIGAMAARIHNQSSSWDPPPGFARHEFDVPGFVGDRPFWGRFWDVPLLGARQRELFLRAREGISEILGAYPKDPRIYSMLHADLHPKNFVVTDTEKLHVIDFDDSGFGWHLYELAVALCEFEDEPYFDSITAALAAGYRAVRPLRQQDLDLLPLFLVIRRLVSIGWIWDRPELGRRARIPLLIEEACREIKAFGF